MHIIREKKLQLIKMTWLLNEQLSFFLPPVSRFIAMVSKPESRAVFMKSAISFLRQNNFDGLNLDWEFPGQGGSMASDKDRFSALVAVRRLLPSQTPPLTGSSPHRLLPSQTPPLTDSSPHSRQPSCGTGNRVHLTGLGAAQEVTGRLTCNRKVASSIPGSS